MGDSEFGKCDICDVETNLQRTYFHYDIKCNCHSPNHFEIVRHCNNCKPNSPLSTKVVIKPINIS